MTFSEFEKKISTALADAGVENSSTEAASLISEILDISNGELAFRKAAGKLVSADEETLISSALVRRIKHEPLQYITGRAYFRDLVLNVNSDVLIPRFETELLVDRIVKSAAHGAKVLDIGTGSGAIAVSCAYERKDFEVLALDISEAALETARSNAGKYQLENISFRKSDLFSALAPEEKFDVIAANLPYVTFEEYAVLQPEVKDYEPELALTAPDDGLELIYKVCRELDERLNSGGFAIFEMSPHQTGKVAELLEKYGFCCSVISDYTSRERFVCAEKR